MHWNIYLKLREVLDELREVKAELRHFRGAIERNINMSQALNDSIAALQTEVTNLTAVDTAATALINGIADQIAKAIAGAADDSAAVKAVNDVLAPVKASDASLAAAVAANTPAAPPTP